MTAAAPALSVLDLVPVRTGQTSREAIAASLTLAAHADRLGFSRYWFAEHGDDLTMAGPPEFAERAVGLPGLEETYDVTVDGFEPIADGGGPATVDALVGGDVQAANIFSTNPAIEAEGLVVLEDPEGHFAAQNVVPVVRQDRLTADAQAALDAVSAELTTDDLVALNLRVSGEEKAEPATAAADWLEERGLLDS